MLVDTQRSDLVSVADRQEAEQPRNGKTAPHDFVIPKIVVTRAPERPRYSEPIPEQRYDKAVLFVPVKTEELSWDDGGLYWNGTYAYPVHNIYNREGLTIGRRRHGPEGYRFVEVFETRRPVPSDSQDQLDETGDALADANRGDGSRGTAYNVSGVSLSQEEAKVILEEPAPVPVQPLDASDEVEVMSFVDASAPSEHDEDGTDGGSLYGESDTHSLWSRRGSTESTTTTPGQATPTVAEIDGDNRNHQIDSEVLCQKLEVERAKDDALAASTSDSASTVAGEDAVPPEATPPTSRKMPTRGWTPLGSIPRRRPESHMLQQRSCTLPGNSTDRFGFSKSLKLETALDLSKKHRSVSVPASPIVGDETLPAPTSESPPASPEPFAVPALRLPPASTFGNTHESSSGSSGLFSSIANDLAKSPFSTGSMPSKKPLRSQSMSSKARPQRKQRHDRFAFDSDYSAGWAFERGASHLSSDWHMS